jgi:hypothetical protein
MNLAFRRSVIALVTIGAAGCRQPAQQTPQSMATAVPTHDRAIRETAERRAIGVASPQQLYDAYTRNRISAEANYDGQFVKVIGPLVGVERDDPDATVLRLGLGATYASGASIAARFNREDEGPLKDLTVGQVVSVIGSPRYDATDGLVLVRCLLAPRADTLATGDAARPEP